jgi:hypothetical protein
MIRKIVFALIALGLSSSAFSSSPYDYNGQQLGLYFGHVQWHVGFDANRSDDVPETCIAVLTAGEIYYRKSKDEGTANSYHRAAISLAQTWHFNQTEKTDWVRQDIFEAGDAYAEAILNETEFPNSQSWKDYTLKLKDLQRNVAKCEQLYPNQSRAATASDGNDVETSIDDNSAGNAPKRELTVALGCGVFYDAYLRALVEQSYADPKVTIEMRADRDTVWKKIRARSITAINFGTNNTYGLPTEYVGASKLQTEIALENPESFSKLENQVKYCDEYLKLPAIPLGY